MDEFELYLSGFSIPEVFEKTGIPLSTLRFKFKKRGILRSRAEGVRNAAKKGKLGSGLRGKKRIFTDEWKDNIRKAKTGSGLGYRISPSGYKEYTAGPHKGRSEHVILMEEKIGRRLYIGECVHHKDEDKLNNDIDNLQLMTLSSHAKLHIKLRRNKKCEE